MYAHILCGSWTVPFGFGVWVGSCSTFSRPMYAYRNGYARDMMASQPQVSRSSTCRIDSRDVYGTQHTPVLVHLTLHCTARHEKTAPSQAFRPGKQTTIGSMWARSSHLAAKRMNFKFPK